LKYAHLYFYLVYIFRFEADGRAYVKYVDDAELAYVMQRYRELHDFWHVLFDLPPTVYGEIILKYVELVQTGLPVCTLSGFVGPLRVSSGMCYLCTCLKKNYYRRTHCII